MDTLDKNAWIIIGIMALLGLAKLYTLLDQPSGPIAETTGIILSWTQPANNGKTPEIKIAEVKLEEGRMVLAKVSPSHLIQKGDFVRVSTYKRTLSGSLTYEASPQLKPVESNLTHHSSGTPNGAP